MDETVIICRCEEISVEEITLAIQQGATTHDDIKRLTRCGMGQCQSKICRLLVAELIQKQKGIRLADLSVPRLRVPLRPVPLDILATKQSSSYTIKSVLEEADSNTEA